MLTDRLPLISSKDSQLLYRRSYNGLQVPIHRISGAGSDYSTGIDERNSSNQFISLITEGCQEDVLAHLPYSFGLFNHSFGTQNCFKAKFHTCHEVKQIIALALVYQ
jgi:hypothetical protein